MARLVKRDAPLHVALRTEGAAIIPKALRVRQGLRAGDPLEAAIKEGDVILHPRPVRRLGLEGVLASRSDKLTGLVRVGGDALKDKQRLYDR